MLIREMLAKLGMSNPYEGFDDSGFKLDVHGWAKEHPLYNALIALLKPTQIIEVGTWMGFSAIHMANLARAVNPNVTVLCIDTWLGSVEPLWTDPKYREVMRFKNGFPGVYWQFMANVVLSSLTDNIFPLPVTANVGAELLKNHGVGADMVYMDAQHDEYSVYGDLVQYWDVVHENGCVFGNDYNLSWRGVIKAVNRFAADRGLMLLTFREKWCLPKPGCEKLMKAAGMLI